MAKKQTKKVTPVNETEVNVTHETVVAEAPKPEPVKSAPKAKPVLEPASEKDFSPLEKLRTLSGESSA